MDSSAFYAIADTTDRHNSRAKSLLTSQEGLVTTDHVLVETWLLIARKLGEDAAGSAWQAIERGARVEFVDQMDMHMARSIGVNFGDQLFSIVDCTSFAVMQRLGVTRTISFDRHFAIYRYGPKRDRAFEVLR